jgi:hypothetical protein
LEHVLTFEIQVLNQSIKECVFIICIPNKWANILDVKLKGGDVCISRIYGLQELIGDVFRLDLVIGFWELKTVSKAEFELPSLLNPLLFFFLIFHLFLNNLHCLCYLIESIIGSLVVHID